MRLRRSYILFGFFALMMSFGCCCWPHCREHCGCRRFFRPCARCGGAGCSACVTTGYTPCECEPPAGMIAPVPAPTPVPGPPLTAPMPRAATTTGLQR